MGRNETPALVAAAFIGYYPKATKMSSPPCKGCQQWRWINQGQLPCPSPSPPKKIREPETWLLGPKLAKPTLRAGTAENLPLLTMSNEIWSNQCGEPTKFMWAKSDWQQGYSSPADPVLFKVPSNSECPLPSAAGNGRNFHAVRGIMDPLGPLDA
jgi:hypothetical protein